MASYYMIFTCLRCIALTARNILKMLCSESTKFNLKLATYFSIFSEGMSRTPAALVCFKCSLCYAQYIATPLSKTLRKILDLAPAQKCSSIKFFKDAIYVSLDMYEDYKISSQLLYYTAIDINVNIETSKQIID